MKAEWRSALAMSGVLCVMTSGEVLMLVLCVDNWDTLLKVRAIIYRLKNVSGWVHHLQIAMCMSAGVVPFSAAHFGAGIGPIYLDNVECSGSESRLIDCLYSSFVSCSRGHSEDAGVRCQGNISVLISRFFLYPKGLEKSMEEMMLFGPFIGLRWYDLTMQINLIQTYE